MEYTVQKVPQSTLISILQVFFGERLMLSFLGNKILKGFIEKDLVNGAVTFEKIQVKEVTSHFRNGWIFLVVYPKITKEVNNNVLMRGNGININTREIKPLIVEKVVVKAKKMKE